MAAATASAMPTANLAETLPAPVTLVGKSRSRCQTRLERSMRVMCNHAAVADTFNIRIGKVEGARAVLHCLTGFDGYVGLLCTSRSFALMALHDAREHAMDFEYIAPQEPASA